MQHLPHCRQSSDFRFAERRFFIIANLSLWNERDPRFQIEALGCGDSSPAYEQLRNAIVLGVRRPDAAIAKVES